MRNSGTSPDWNRCTTAVRSLVSPVNWQYAMPSDVTSASINRSIEVNCENNNILRPSAISSGNTVDNHSSFADGTASSSLTSRGSQHTCLSFNSASRIVI